MFGIPKKLIDAGKRGAAGAGAVVNIMAAGSAPPTVSSMTNGTKQLASYSKHVRLEGTGRDIKRAIESGTRFKGSQLSAGTQQITKKDLKTLKKQ